MKASPEALVRAQIRYFTRVAEYEPILNLPISLALLWVERMSIRALNTDIFLIEFLLLGGFFEFFALFFEILDAIMLLSMEVI